MQMQTVEQVKKRIDYLLERDRATEAEIEKVYNEAVDTLRAIVSDVHNRYAVDGVVVPANLYGKVTVKDMLLLKQQYDKLPDDLSAQEQDRVDYYTAMSQTSPRGLITALVGMALIGVTHKVGKIIAKNNRTAVKEEIAYQVEHENAPKLTIKKYAGPEFKVEAGKNFVPWNERMLSNHDQAVNRINNVINGMVSQGMRAEDIANHFYPGNAQSMREDNIPKILRDATVKAKRTARTEAAAREDAIVEQSFKANDVKYYDWVTEPGACKICTGWAISGPYKVGNESSPRIPGDSHPNCRCRRIVKKESIVDEIDWDEVDIIVLSDKDKIPSSPKTGGNNNDIILQFKNGKPYTIRQLDSYGYSKIDFDLSDHGNSKTHPNVPHVHFWTVDRENDIIERSRDSIPRAEHLEFIKKVLKNAGYDERTK